MAFTVTRKPTQGGARALRDIRGQRDLQLDRQTLLKEYGAQTVKALPRGLTTAHGPHPDLAAEALGFASGQDLLLALLDAQETSETALIERMVDEEMTRRHWPG
jgi:hypothetical protein